MYMYNGVSTTMAMLQLRGSWSSENLSVRSTIGNRGVARIFRRVFLYTYVHIHMFSDILHFAETSVMLQHFFILNGYHVVPGTCNTVYIYLCVPPGSAQERSSEDVCSEVPEKEAHCRHSPARAHIL